MPLLGSALQDVEYQTCKSGPTWYFTCEFNLKHVASPINSKKITHVLKAQAQVLPSSGVRQLGIL